MKIMAVYRNGMFEPLEPIDLPDNTFVTLEILDVYGVDLPEGFSENLDEYLRELSEKSD